MLHVYGAVCFTGVRHRHRKETEKLMNFWQWSLSYCMSKITSLISHINFWCSFAFTELHIHYSEHRFDCVVCKPYLHCAVRIFCSYVLSVEYCLHGRFCLWITVRSSQSTRPQLSWCRNIELSFLPRKSLPRWAKQKLLPLISICLLIAVLHLPW